LRVAGAEIEKRTTFILGGLPARRVNVSRNGLFSSSERILITADRRSRRASSPTVRLA
jgi:hypothetical protein